MGIMLGDLCHPVLPYLVIEGEFQFQLRRREREGGFTILMKEERKEGLYIQCITVSYTCIITSLRLLLYSLREGEGEAKCKH